MKRLSLFWILLTGFASIIHAENASVHVTAVQLIQDTSMVGVLIETDHSPVYSITEGAHEVVRVRIDDAAGYNFTKSDNPLWEYAPFERFRVTQQYGNLYLEIYFSTNAQYQIYHEPTSRGVAVEFSGEIANTFHRKVYRKIKDIIETASPENPVQIREAKQIIPNLPTPLLQQVFSRSKSSQATDIFELATTTLKARKLLTQQDLLSAAKVLEEAGDVKKAEELSYQYYHNAVTRNPEVFTDKIPGSASSTRTAHGEAQVPEISAVNSISFPEFLRGENFLIGGGIFILLLSGTGFWAIQRRKKRRTPDYTQQDSRDFLTALQVKMTQANQDAVSHKIPHSAGSKHEQMQPKKRETVTRSKPAAPVSVRTKSQLTESDLRRESIRRRKEARRMLKQGLSRERIAQRLDMSQGEVELLLKLAQSTTSEKQFHSKVPGNTMVDKNPRDIARQWQITEEEAKLLKIQREQRI